MASSLKQVKSPITPKEKSRLFNLIDRFSSTSILVVGDFILDEFVWGSVRRISPEAPVPIVEVDRQSFMPGGALNVAHNIKTLAGTVYPCGVVGRKDIYGRMLVREIRREKIDTGGVIYDANRQTTLKTRVIAHSQQVVRFDRENADDLKPVDTKAILNFAKRIAKNVQAIIIGDYGKGVVTPELIRGLVQLAKIHQIPVLVDPKEKNFAYYKNVTAVTPNKKEAYAAYGSENDSQPASLQEVGKGLLKKFKCDSVLITLGEEGMALFEKKGSVTKIPTAAREVYDVSGAGDTVIAVFALALATGASMKEAAIIANAAAGVVVGKLGTATLTRQELKDALSGQSS